jgi:NET1-associated nuclear protein 1 (U3 small nucleolar RNA-associated protein 17)
MISTDPTTTLDLPSNSRQRSTPLGVHKTSSTLILPSSHPSSLQIYSPSTSKLMSELEVSPSNRVSRRDQKPIEQSCVEHVAVSLSGAWMASIDTREGDDSIRGETYLKIWCWDFSNSRWVLNTRIDRPHGLTRITSISFSPAPTLLQLVTTGEDGNVRMWRPRTVKTKTEGTEGTKFPTV